jgi:hypothetical protein
LGWYKITEDYQIKNKNFIVSNSEKDVREKIKDIKLLLNIKPNQNEGK